MFRYLPPLAVFLLLTLVGAGLLLSRGNVARAAIGGVSSSQPIFSPGDELTITVLAQDDIAGGPLTIISNLAGSEAHGGELHRHRHQALGRM